MKKFLLLTFSFLILSSPTWAAETRQVTLVQGNASIQVEIPLTPKKELEEFDLEKLERLYSQYSQSQKRNSMMPSVPEFTYESAVFFAAIGALNLSQMYMDYGANPQLLAQHIQSLTDPIAHISFYNFMVANRAFSLKATFLQKYTPKAFPYLGMTVGMVASQLTSVALTPLKDCSTALLTKQPNSRAICQKAWEKLVVSDVIFDLAPSITNMLAASYAAKMVESGSARIAKGQVTKVILTRAILPALLIIPSGKFISAAGKALIASGPVAHKTTQVSLFIGLDHLLNPLLFQPVKAFKESALASFARFPDLRKKLLLELGNPQQRFSSDSMDSLKKSLLSLDHWKEYKMAKVIEAHQAWEAKFDLLARKSQIIEKFYGMMVRKIQMKRFEDVDAFSKTYLSGIYGIQKDANDRLKEDQYLANTTERFRLRNLALISEDLRKFEAEQNYRFLTDYEKSFFKRMTTEIDSKDQTRIVQLMSDLTYKQKDMRFVTTLSPIALQKWKQIELQMGQSEVTANPGQGLLEAFERNPEVQEVLAGLHVPVSIGKYEFKRYSDYLVYSMICGPQAQGDNITAKSDYFRDELLVPRIIPADAKAEDFCRFAGARYPTEKMYEDSIEVVINGQKRSFKGALDLIVSLATEQIIGKNAEDKAFTTWYQNFVQLPIGNLVNTHYKALYQKIIMQFLGTFSIKSPSKLGDYASFGLPHGAGDIYRQRYILLIETFSALSNQKGEVIAGSTPRLINLGFVKVPKILSAVYGQLDSLLQALETQESNQLDIGKMFQALKEINDINEKLQKEYLPTLLKEDKSNSKAIEYLQQVVSLMTETNEALKSDLLALNTVGQLTQEQNKEARELINETRRNSDKSNQSQNILNRK